MGNNAGSQFVPDFIQTCKWPKCPQNLTLLLFSHHVFVLALSVFNENWELLQLTISLEFVFPIIIEMQG